MGSYSASTSNATDNRQAVTDSGFGLSSSGKNNNVALSGHILNIGNMTDLRHSANFGSKQNLIGGNPSGFGGRGDSGAGGSSGATGGGGLEINILDGDAINKSFDFAAFSLSEVLGAIVGSNKQTAEQLAGAQVSTMETIGGAIQQAGTVTAQAAQQAAETSNKGLLIVGGAVAVWWFFMRGKK